MSKAMFSRSVSCTLLMGAMAAHGQLARTPPMGWNSWNTFAGNIDENKIKQIADAMVSNGMRDAGYIYLNLDDNWMANPARDGQGNLIADPTRFKSGIRALADYVHSKGLKLGIYNDRGSQTCMNIPQSGGYGNEERDAKTYASWGVDYLKYDNCYARGEIQADYRKMGNALLATGREIVYSICAWHTETWMPQVGQLWRSGEDITDTWYNPNDTRPGWSVLKNYEVNIPNFIFTRPGAWSDPDMLEVGNGRLTEEENKSHFALWALAAAPLITGNDLRSMSSSTLAILTHPEVIAIDQDSAGIQGRRIVKNGDRETWVKPLGVGYDTYAVGLFNRSGSATSMTVKWSDLRLEPASVTVRDIWGKKDLGLISDAYTVQVPAHGLALLKVKGVPDTKAAWWLSDLHFTALANNGNQFVKVDLSNGGKQLKLGSKTYAKGLGVFAVSRVVAPLGRRFDRFQTDVGIDAETGSGGSAIFQVFGDGKKLYESPLCKGGAPAVAVDVSVADVDSLALVVTDGGDGTANDHADWAGAKLIPKAQGVAIRNWAPRSMPVHARVQGKTLVLDGLPGSPAQARLLDSRGRMVLQASVSSSEPSIRLPELSRGIYSLQVAGETRSASRIVLGD